MTFTRTVERRKEASGSPVCACVRAYMCACMRACMCKTSRD